MINQNDIKLFINIYILKEENDESSTFTHIYYQQRLY